MHLLLFATRAPLFGSQQSRLRVSRRPGHNLDALGSAILTVETSFLIALAASSWLLAVSTFVALEIQRSAVGAVSPPFESGSPMARQLNRALGLTSGLVALGTLAIGTVLFFYDSALHRRLLECVESSTRADDRLQRQRHSRRYRKDQAKHRSGNAHQRQRRPVARTEYALARRRVDELRRQSVRFTPTQEPTVVLLNSDGDYTVNAARLPDADFRPPLHYTVLMEPTGTDALFIALRAASLRAVTLPTRRTVPAPGARRGYLVVDKTGSVFNPFHNDTKVQLRRHFERTHDPPGSSAQSRHGLSRNDSKFLTCNCRYSIRESNHSPNKSRSRPRILTTKLPT